MPSIDITILNGLPVTVSFDVEPPDRDVGYMSAHIEGYDITHINGHRNANDNWLLKKIDAKESNRIMGLCYNSVLN